MKTLLESSRIFNLWQQIAGAESWKKRFVQQYVKPFLNAKILDIGCGTGALLEPLSKNINVNYTGCDTNAGYISYAKNKWEDKAKFFCSDVSSLPSGEKDFDIIIINAVLHHLTDKGGEQTVLEAKNRLKRGGRFILSEPVWTEKQSRFEKYLMKNDRGKNIKTEEQYLQLLRKVFSTVHSEIIYDSHIIPWTVTVITAS